MTEKQNRVSKTIVYFIVFSLFIFAATGCSKTKSESQTDTVGTDTDISDEDAESDIISENENTVPASDQDAETESGQDDTVTESEQNDADMGSGQNASDEDNDDDDDDGDDNNNDSADQTGDPDEDNGTQDDVTDSDTVVSDPKFIKQPKKMNIAPKNQSVTLACKAEADGYSIHYSWYETPDGTTDTGTAVAGADGMNFNTPVFSEKGIHYYYCVATLTPLSDGTDEADTAALISDVASVAYTALPTVFIDTPDGVAITSKEEWIKNAVISLVGAEESLNFENVSTSIRGRGNTTWLKPKKPYALKLDKKQKIFGLPAHKRWVLIANYLDNSFMRNETAFYLSRIFEMDWTVGGDFADLVLNGEYQGLYWLGEAIKVDKNRVNINDGSEDMADNEDKDYLVEMDKYYDEPVKFKSSVRNLPYMIKNDDYMVDDSGELSSGGTARLERFMTKINDMENLLYPDFTAEMDTNDCSAPDESYTGIIDIDSWAKFWFVNEIMDNGELIHPKSAYFTFDSANNVFKAGPVWDFDWASLYQRLSCLLKKTLYYNALFKSPAFKTRVKELWGEYSGVIDTATLIESMRSRLSVAAEYDTMLWGKHDDPSGVKRENFDAYVDFFKEAVLNKISVINADVSAMK